MDFEDNRYCFLTAKTNYNTTHSPIRRLFAHRQSKHQYSKDKQAVLNVTYVSPLSEKSKKTPFAQTYYRKNQTGSLNISKRQQINSFSFKQFLQRSNKHKNKTYKTGKQKRKNIRQYFNQLSQSKQKRGGKTLQSRTEQLKSAINEELMNTNTSLTVQKVKNGSKSIERVNSIFRDRDTPPIHYTQIYLFAKKKVRTQSSEKSIQRYIQNGREQVTMSRVLEFRQGLLSRAAKQTKKQSEECLMDEIHPTVAIITTRQEITVSKQSQESTLPEKKAKNESSLGKAMVLRRREEQEISPWHRKNIPQFDYI